MLDRLLNSLRTVAPDRVDIPILQPADPFLETAGEDLRRRIFITNTNGGEVQCLRPEFTIPICLAHLESGTSAGRYAYGGTVFRQQRPGGFEFQQVGLEDLGNNNSVEADAACIGEMLDTLGEAGVAKPQLVLGDQNLFAVVVENLQLPDAIAQRLVRNFGSSQTISDLIDRLTQGRNEETEPTAVQKLALEGNEPVLVDHILKMMGEANLAESAGRNASDIAARMIRKAGEGSFLLDANHADILRRFLAMETPLADTPDALNSFSKETGIGFGAAGEAFSARIDALNQRGNPLDSMTYRASFGRNLEYYSGVLFEAVVDGTAIAGGGRYDRLCTLLGADAPVPAIGFSLALDRVEAVL